MKKGEAGLQCQDPHQQEGRLIRLGHGVVDRVVNNIASQIRKRQAQKAGNQQRRQGGRKPSPVGPQIPEQLQRLPEVFPVQLRLWEIDAGLVIA